MPRLQLPDQECALDYADEGSGQAVVLLHAFATDREMWAPQVQALSGRYRLIVPSLRGFGGSSPTDEAAVSMERYADDVLALMNHLGLARVVVGGISLGGYVALALALRNPERLAGLVLANTRAVADDPDYAWQREALVADTLLGGSLAVVKSYGDRLLGAHCPTTTREWLREVMLRQRPGALISCTRGMMARPDRSPALASIDVPTLVVHGGEDQLIAPAASLAMHAAIRGSRYVELAGAGHLSSIDSPDAFNQALSTFLDTLAAGSTG